MGTALDTARDSYGHDPGYYDIPYSSYLYIARRLRDAGAAFRYIDLQARQHCDLPDFDAIFHDTQPRVLITQVNLPSFEHDLALVGRARRAAPDLQVILLGATGKWFRDRILLQGLADVVMEEAEELLVSDNALALLRQQPDDLQGCSVRRDGAVVHLPARVRMESLDFIDFPAYEKRVKSVGTVAGQAGRIFALT